LTIREVPGGERAKVFDFGIAKLAGEHAGVKTRTACGADAAGPAPRHCSGDMNIGVPIIAGPVTHLPRFYIRV
jgi:hypothetical protein